MKGKSDYIFLGVLVLIAAISVNNIIVNDISFTATNYIAVIAWLIAIIMKLSKNKFARYTIGILIMLGTFNICNFLPGTTWMSIGFGNTPLLQFNPVLFVILLTWYFVNKREIKEVYARRFKDSTEEEAAKYQKMVDFYIEKFSSCTSAELDTIYANIDAYPDEAKTALRKIKDTVRQL